MTFPKRSDTTRALPQPWSEQTNDVAGATEIEMQHLHNELVIPGGPLNTVDKKQTIHRIRNLAEWEQPAVSMHVYSRPIDSCVVFDLEAQRCFRRDLKYDNE